MKVVGDRRGMISPEEWIDSVVVPALQDFQSEPASLHKAVCAVTLAHHVSDRVFHYYDQHDPTVLRGAKTEGRFLADIIQAEQCRALELARDFANATKHHFLKPSPRQTLAHTATGAATWGGHGYTIGDTDYPVGKAVAEVIQFWQDWRKKHPISGVDP